MAKRKPKKSKAKAKTRSRKWRWILSFLALLLVVSVVYVFWLNIKVVAKFEGQRWDLPTRVYARGLEVYPGADIGPAQLERELRFAGYRESSALQPGTFLRGRGDITIATRRFTFSDGTEPARVVEVGFAGARVADLRDRQAGNVSVLRLDPALIGSIYPDNREDRHLVALEDVPDLLIAGLLAVEDNRFLEHHGVDMRGTARAMLANLRARRLVQGGSTITQQLVKNLFLSTDRKLVRKANEAVMALLLEAQYSKDEILETYLNEVYLAQRGRYAIHGFGLGARFYFDRDLGSLTPAQMATLIGTVKGPSYYNPRRNPERALERRNLVIDEMREYGVLDDDAAARARSEPLGVRSDDEPGDIHAAYMDLVRRELQANYDEDDLKTQGLRVFTALDPLAQGEAVSQLHPTLLQLPSGGGPLEGAMVMVGADTGEVVALVGGRKFQPGDFNRALEARRQVGSVFKPVVYLHALNHPQDFTLATMLNDDEFTLQTPQGPWTPSNFDGEYHGQVPLIEALVRSFNVATVYLAQRLGGMEEVLDTMEDLGVVTDQVPVPAMALGAIELTPLQVAQLYQGIASGGYPSALRAVRDVLTADGDTLDRYPLSLGRLPHPESTYLITKALQEVTRTGTGAGLSRLMNNPQVAGKTGTSNQGRDTWFAGFDGSHLAVAWIGKDNNEPTPLTGASGAMRYWANVMDKVSGQPLDPVPPAGLEFAWVDLNDGGGADRQCPDAVELPFIQDSAPRWRSACLGPGSDQRDERRGLRNWLRDTFSDG